MAGNLIPNAFIRWHFATIAKNPALVAKLKEQYDIPVSVFSDAGRILSADQYAQILRQTIELSDDESFCSLQRPIRRGSFHLMAQACISCDNLEQVIARCIKFYSLLNEQINWQLIIDGDECQFKLDLHQPDNQDYSYFSAFNSCIIWRWLSWMIDKQISLNQIDFNFPEHESHQDIAQIFNQAVYYQQSHIQLCFPARYLKQPVKQTPQSLHLFLRRVPECLLSHYQEEMSVKKQVYDYLQSLDNLNDASVAKIAEHFHCSEQSLIRSLRKEGTRFKVLQDNLQKQRAKHLLLKTQLSNQQISLQLGFSETSVFYRNCKKWFSQTPNQFRQQLDSV